MPCTFTTTFGELLRSLRQQAGLTQQEFGQAVGYSHAHVARLEGGKRLPDITAVRSLFVEALGLRPDSEQARLPRNHLDQSPTTCRSR